jgi:hypothetical protein
MMEAARLIKPDAVAPRAHRSQASLRSPWTSASVQESDRADDVAVGVAGRDEPAARVEGPLRVWHNSSSPTCATHRNNGLPLETDARQPRAVPKMRVAAQQT